MATDQKITQLPVIEDIVTPFDTWFVTAQSNAIANNRMAAQFVATWVNKQSEFAVLTDVTGDLTTPHALYKVNAAADAYEETQVTMPDGPANTVEFNKGTTNINISADFQVTATCTIDQDLQVTAQPQFDRISIGGAGLGLISAVLRHTSAFDQGVFINSTNAGNASEALFVKNDTIGPGVTVQNTLGSNATTVLDLIQDGTGPVLTNNGTDLVGNNGKFTAPLINSITYGDSSTDIEGVALGAQDEPLLSNGTAAAPKFGTMRLAPAVQSAAGATPVDSDLSSLNDDTFGSIVGTGGRVFFFWKNAADVYYVEATAL